MTLDPRITFSRASLGTYYGSDGLLKYAAHNFALQSQTFDNASWTKSGGATVTADATTAPDGTTTADRLNHVTAGTVAGGLVSGISLATVFGGGILCSVYAKAGTKNWLIIGMNGSTNNAGQHCFFDLATGVVGAKGSVWASSGISAAGSGWYRCWALLNSTGLNAFTFKVAEADLTATCTSPGDIYIWGAQCEYVTTATTPSTYLPTTTVVAGGPRFDYDPVTHAAKGLLIEEARTNPLGDSQDFSSVSWLKTGSTVTANSIAAPDGTTTADTLTASASPATVDQGATNIGTGLVYTQSIFAKKGTSDWFYMCALITTSATQAPKAYFNLAAGTIGTIEALITAATIQDVGNGWYRCSITSVATAGTEKIQAGICDANNSATVTVGRTIYLWGAQSEAAGATFASSYIPTVSSTTRAADVATMTGTDFSSWYNQPAGTFVAEFDVFATTLNRVIMSVDNGSVAEQISLLAATLGVPRVTVIDNSVIQFSTASLFSAISVSATHKLGLSSALNDFAACLDGGTPLLDTGGTLPTPTTLRIGNDFNGISQFSGHLRRIRFFNVAKSDAQIITLTTLDAALPTVTLAWTTDEFDTTPSFTVTFSGMLIGDVLTLEVDDDYLFGSLFDSESVTLTAPMIAAGTVTMGSTIAALTIGTTYNARVKVSR